MNTHSFPDPRCREHGRYPRSGGEQRRPCTRLGSWRGRLGKRTLVSTGCPASAPLPGSIGSWWTTRRNQTSQTFRKSIPNTSSKASQRQTERPRNSISQASLERAGYRSRLGAGVNLHHHRYLTTARWLKGAQRMPRHILFYHQSPLHQSNKPSEAPKARYQHQRL